MAGGRDGKSAGRAGEPAAAQSRGQEIDYLLSQGWIEFNPATRQPQYGTRVFGYCPPQYGDRPGFYVWERDFRQSDQGVLTWRFLHDEWDLIEADFAEVFGTDLDDPAVRPRSWRWFMVRLHGLLNRPAANFLRIDVDEKSYRWSPVWTTRTQTALYGHPLDK